MSPDVVVDIGNTRIKWGRCTGDRVREMASLPPGDPGAWHAQADRWDLRGGSHWVVADVQPARREALVGWLRQRGEQVWLIDTARLLPLRVSLAEPDKVGLDRLLDAVAANALRPPSRPAVIIDAGSAVTVDLVDGDGTFCGGAIIPGFRPMAQALHDYTALLPLVQIDVEPPALGKSTTAAMHAGIYWTLVGGVRMLAEKIAGAEARPHVFLTGGDADKIAAHFPGARLEPTLTLTGILQTALHHSRQGASQ